MMMDPAEQSIRVCILLPMKGHPGLVWEALDSLFEQSCPEDFGLVLVNDGCLRPASRHLAGLPALAPPNLHIRHATQRNQGLSAARNTGITVALDAFPQLEGVYFLDADNRLGPNAVAAMLSALRRAPEGDWYYPDRHMFGVPLNEPTGIFLTLDEMLARNYCDAGSLVNARLLRAGLRFDETMRDGYEDWDFWLSAYRDGFGTAVHLPGLDLHYRQRRQSMIVESRAKDEELKRFLARKHAWAEYRAPTAAELARGQAPVLLVDEKACQFAAGPDHCSAPIPRREAVERFWAHGYGSERGAFPARIIFIDRDLVGLLRRNRLHRWALWQAQNGPGLRAVALGAPQADASVASMDLRRRQRSALGADRVALFSVPSKALIDDAQGGELGADLAGGIDGALLGACHSVVALSVEEDRASKGATRAMRRFLRELRRQRPRQGAHRTLWSLRPPQNVKYVRPRKSLTYKGAEVGPMIYGQEGDRPHFSVILSEGGRALPRLSPLIARFRSDLSNQESAGHLILCGAERIARCEGLGQFTSIAFLPPPLPPGQTGAILQDIEAMSWGSQALLVSSDDALVTDLCTLRSPFCQFVILDDGRIGLDPQGCLNRTATMLLEHEHSIDRVICASATAAQLLVQHGFPADKLAHLGAAANLGEASL